MARKGLHDGEGWEGDEDVKDVRDLGWSERI